MSFGTQKTKSFRSKKTTLRNLYLLFSLALVASLVWPFATGHQPFKLGLDLAGGAMVTYRADFENVPERYQDTARSELLSMAKETLSGRLMHLYETLPDVVLRQDGRLVVSLPGEYDQREILENLGRTYRLTFRQALATYEAAPEEPVGLVLPYGGRYLQLGEELIAGDALDPGSIRVDLGKSRQLEELGRGIAVSFEFAPPYDRQFAQITRDSIGKTLAILLDEEVQWAGEVQEEIRGPGQLRGAYNLEQASEIANLLRAGNLPISLHIESLSAIGPSLGQEILGRGMLALGFCVAMLAVLIAVAYGHRSALLITGWTSLAFLLLFTLGLIRLFGLTVDLVAIAGLVLSIGMGMDAFILIFEALESSLLAGRGSSTSSEPLRELRRIYSFGGEGRTLVHANATTLVVVVLLLASDRLRAFALFLILGLAASLLTLLATRHMLMLFADRGWLKSDGNGERRFFQPLTFLRLARPRLLRFRRAYGLALILFLATTLVVMALQAPSERLSLGADFQPGMQLQIQTQPAEIEPLVNDLRAAFPEIEARYQELLAEDDAAHEAPSHLLTLEGKPWRQAQWQATASHEPGESTASSPSLSPGGLANWLLEKGVHIESMHSIDARLSSRRTLASMGVLVFSFLLLGFYLAVMRSRIDQWLQPVSSAQKLLTHGEPGSEIRTEHRGARIFAGTLLAVGVDVLVVVAALALLHIPIGMPVIAALLTTIGYSVNDSVVLACHLEGRAGNAERSSTEGLQAGVDAILSRTVLTSFSTLVPAVTILVADLGPLLGFAWTMLVGTTAGTLSSIFIVSSFALGDAIAGRPRDALT